MLLTCPTCRSGLQVPDGTAAMVRCPACKSVFSSADGLTPPGPALEERPERDREPERSPRTANRQRSRERDDDRPRRRDRDDDRRGRPDRDERERERRRDRDRDDDERSRGKGRPVEKDRDESQQPKSENRDFDPDDPTKRPRKRKRLFDDDELSEEERKLLKAAFLRAAWGCKLIWISIILFMSSMGCIIVYWFGAAFGEPSPVFLMLAGVVGVFNWILGLIGIGLCLSGPPSPGHWGYGIAAAIAAVLHAILLLGLIASVRDMPVGSHAYRDPATERWALVPTRMDTVTIYLAVICYPSEELVSDSLGSGSSGKNQPRSHSLGLSLVVGVVEMIRIVLIMMVLSCLSRAAGDEDLSGACTRAGGTASLGPGVLAVVMLLYAVMMIETNAQTGTFTRIIFTTLCMGVYAVLGGTMLRAMFAARDATDVCEEPYQSQLPKL